MSYRFELSALIFGSPLRRIYEIYHTHIQAVKAVRGTAQQDLLLILAYDSLLGGIGIHILGHQAILQLLCNDIPEFIWAVNMKAAGIDKLGQLEGALALEVGV